MTLKNLTFDAREILQTHYSIFLQTHFFVSCLSIDYIRILSDLPSSVSQVILVFQHEVSLQRPPYC